MDLEEDLIPAVTAGSVASAITVIDLDTTEPMTVPDAASIVPEVPVS